MSTIFRSVAIRGISAQCVEIEARKNGGQPSLTIVGLPDTACRESRERVRAAIVAVCSKGISGHITVGLAPAAVRKEGSGFDLAICLAVLDVEKLLAVASVARRIAAGIFVGELTMAGELRSVRGTIAAAELARREGRVLILPRKSAALAALVTGVTLVAVDSLRELKEILAGHGHPRPLDEASRRKLVEEASSSLLGERDSEGEDYRDVRGQPHAVRAATIAAAGGHGLLMVGPPGCGKSMVARRLPGILPELDDEEYLEVARVRTTAEAMGRLPSRRRPFRAPHHTTSSARLVGGGSPPVPGEVTLAHRGVLFLDELPEFSRDAVDALREPMELGFATIARVRGCATFPCRFQFIAAMNPCPCGWHGDRLGRCRCSALTQSMYATRVSGPVRDRIDLHVTLRAVAAAELAGRPGTPSAELLTQVAAARARQRGRLRPRAGESRTNGQMTARELEQHVTLDTMGNRLLEVAVDRFGLSARGRARTLAVARTIADLADEAQVSPAHVSEALSYRQP